MRLEVSERVCVWVCAGGEWADECVCVCWRVGIVHIVTLTLAINGAIV